MRSAMKRGACPVWTAAALTLLFATACSKSHGTGNTNGSAGSSSGTSGASSAGTGTSSGHGNSTGGTSASSGGRSGSAGAGTSGGAGKLGGDAGKSAAGAGGQPAPGSDTSCDQPSDCTLGEIDHEILKKQDCMCLFGCVYLPINRTTFDRRNSQYMMLCDPRKDGAGNPCPIDDCVQPSQATCTDHHCAITTGQQQR